MIEISLEDFNYIYKNCSNFFSSLASTTDFELHCEKHELNVLRRLSFEESKSLSLSISELSIYLLFEKPQQPPRIVEENSTR